MERNELFKYVKKVYGVMPEYPWKDEPESAVFRNNENNKWFGLVMHVSKNKLGITEDGAVDILNVKTNPDMAAYVKNVAGFYPAYHMNKEHWLSILLDGTVSETKVLDFIDRSFELVEPKKIV